MPVRDISISTKLVLLIMATNAMALLLAGAGVVVLDVYLTRVTIRRDLATLAHLFAESTAPALAFDDAQAASDTLAALRTRPFFVSACLYRADGSTFAEYARPGALPECPSPPVGEELYFSRAEASVFEPVILDGRRIGMIFLRRDLTDYFERRVIFATVVFALLVMSGLIAFLLSGRLRGLISRPVSALAGMAKEVSATRDYALRAARQSGDEIGQLVDAFNEMLSNIEERDRELRQARDELEQRVAERTSELQRELAERRRAEQQLHEALADLRRSNADLQQFAYVASHDLQEPLRMVTSYVQLLAEEYRGKLDADADEFIHFAVEGALRMKQLITDLLTYSRVGTHGSQFASTSPEEVLQDAIANLEISLRESGAAVTHDPLPAVLADRSQLLQVFQNLISNGLKFRGAEAPRIHVSARREGPDWLFSVADNGIGIASEHAERIFIIFQRLHTRLEYPGTGIGLAICKKVIERHGGRIWVESEPGRGSIFCFTLPALARQGFDEQGEPIGTTRPAQTG